VTIIHFAAVEMHGSRRQTELCGGEHRNAGITEMDLATECLYLGDHGVDRHCLIL